MRFLKWLVAIVLVLVLAAWFGGETLLAQQARKMIESDPAISADGVAPMRSPTRAGLRISGLRLEDGSLSLPQLDLWVPPWAPTEFHAALPPQFTAAPEGVALNVTAQDASGSLHFAPTASLALSSLRADSGAISVNGAPVLDHFALTADLAQIGPDAPRAAGAGYAVALDLTGLALPDAPDLPDTGPVSAKGRAFVWLTDAPARGILSGRGTDVQLVGVESRDGLVLMLGGLTARVLGRVSADAQGLAEGTALIYTRDAEGFVALAERAGILPAKQAQLARATLANLSKAPLPAGDWPTPEAGEVQLALQLRGGQIFFGPLALGAAPRLMTP